MILFTYISKALMERSRYNSDFAESRCLVRNDMKYYIEVVPELRQ